MINIPGFETFKKIEPINKGWTKDKKYYIETDNKRQLLLRIADVSEYERKKYEYDILKQVAELDIPMPRPVDFGFCDDNKNVYQLLTWVDGEDVQSVLPTITKTEQYNIGLKSGELLRKIHSIPAPGGIEDWNIKFNRMVNEQINEYHSRTELHSELGEIIIEYFNQNCDMLGTRPQSFIHGDYNPGNIIIMPNGEVGVIDFASGYGDPCWDISKAGWHPTLYPYFYSGLIRGHSDCEPTIEYWSVYTHCWALYAFYALTGPQWVGLDNFENGMNIVRDILAWSDNLTNPIPKWYVDNTMSICN